MIKYLVVNERKKFFTERKNKIVVANATFGVRYIWIKIPALPWLAVWPWGSYLTSLSFNFLIYKVKPDRALWNIKARQGGGSWQGGAEVIEENKRQREDAGTKVIQGEHT